MLDHNHALLPKTSNGHSLDIIPTPVYPTALAEEQYSPKIVLINNNSNKFLTQKSIKFSVSFKSHLLGIILIIYVILTYNYFRKLQLRQLPSKKDAIVILENFLEHKIEC